MLSHAHSCQEPFRERIDLLGIAHVTETLRRGRPGKTDLTELFTCFNLVVSGFFASSTDC